MRAFRFLAVAAVLASGSVAAACGSTADNPNTGGQVNSGTNVDDGEGGITNTEAGTGYPALLPPDPPQVQSYGGPVLKAAKIVPIFFSKDDAAMVASLTDFTSKIGATDYWKAINTEYGASAASMGNAIALGAEDDPPTTFDDTAIQEWLATKLEANDPRFGTPDGNTLYALYYPAGITITLGGTPPPDGGVVDSGDVDAGDEGGTDGGADGGDGGRGPRGAQKSCQSFGGYHNNIQLDQAHGGLRVAYAVIPRCSTFGDLKGIDAVTGAASHEFVEATTDPYPDPTFGNPAYAQIDDAHFYWESFLGGGEIGDMCAQDPASFTKFTELAYTVQRSWSNKAAKTGHDPCQPPLPGSVYFNSAPNFKDMVPITVGTQTVMVKGVKIAAGMSGTVELDLWSDAPTTGDWTVDALDQAALSGQTPQLTFAYDKMTGHNGDKIMMTITVVTASKRNRETFVVESKLGGRQNTWIGVVGN